MKNSATVEHRLSPIPPRRGLVVGFSNLLGFAYGVLWGVYIPFYGQFYGSEVLALSVLAVVGPLAILRKLPALKRIFLGYGLLLLGLVLADLFNDTTFQNQVRGAASVMFAVIDLAFLAFIFRRDPRAILFVLLGLSLARVFSVDTVRDLFEFEQSNDFKARIVPVLFPAALIVGHYLSSSKRSLAITASFFIGLIFIVFEARSAGVIFILGAAFMSIVNINLRGKQKAFLVICVTLAIYTMYIIYVDWVLSNPAQTNSYIQLSRSESPYNPLSLLKEGRADPLIALAAISEKPILGWGSWAVDVGDSFALMRADLIQADQVYLTGYIASHSVMLTAWLWGGIIGFSGYLIVFFTIGRRGMKMVKSKSPFQLIVSILIIEFFWNSFFSPFGHIRTSIPIIGAFVLAGVHGKNEIRKSVGRFVRYD